MLNKISQMISGKGLDMRERIFRLIIVTVISVAILGMAETILFVGSSYILIPIGTLLVSMSIVAILTFKYHKIDISANIVGIILLVIVFPCMFFLCGGVYGGASIWFALGIFYCFMMFRGKRLGFFVLLAVSVDVVIYIIGYEHPEFIMGIETRKMIYLDSLFSVICVGFASGLFVEYFTKVYEQERGVTLKQRDELEKVGKSKNNFFVSMSHELRTPINSILGLNEMILRENRDENTREYAFQIKYASKMLLNLVNDILDISRIEMEKMEIVENTYELRNLISGLVNMIKIPVSDKKLEFFVDIDENLPSKLWGDEKRMQQVILNLLTNAMKYTDEGSITLSVMGERKLTDQIALKIMVSDTGIGIKKEDVASLYDIFKRVDSKKNNNVEGSGLGLSITKQLVELMGGTISVDSIYTKGSTFTIKVDQTIIDEKPIGAMTYQVEDRVGVEDYYHKHFEAPEARVLIVDDNEMNATVCAKLLAETKMQIDISNNGWDCLEKTKRKYYDVILLDQMMPELSGNETLEKIRFQENGLCKTTSIIAMTANSIDSIEGLYENNGFDGYIEKPIQVELLESTLLKFIPEEIVEYKEPAVETEEAEETEVLNSIRRRKKKIMVSTDCLCDLPKEMLDEYNVKVMYLYVKTKTGRFADTREIHSDMLTQEMLMEDGVHADSVSVGEYEEFFAQALTEAEELIHISVAKESGISYGVAVEAAKSFDHVHVIDSGQISCGEGLVTIQAAKLAMEGKTTQEIINRLELVKGNIHSRFVLPSIDMFYSNGHTSKAMAKLCKVFRIKPIITSYHSKLRIVGWSIGSKEKVWKKFFMKELSQYKKISPELLVVTFAGCNKQQQMFIRKEIEKGVKFDKIIMQKSSVSNVCNAGVYSVGLAYYKGELYTSQQ